MYWRTPCWLEGRVHSKRESEMIACRIGAGVGGFVVKTDSWRKKDGRCGGRRAGKLSGGALPKNAVRRDRFQRREEFSRSANWFASEESRLRVEGTEVPLRRYHAKKVGV